MTDDDGFHAIDSVDADDFGTRHHAQLTGVRARRLAEASPQALCPWGVARTHDDENASAAPEGIDSRSACGPAMTANDEVDGTDHCVDLAPAGPATSTGPLNARKNASSCRARVASVSAVRRIDCSVRWVSVIAVSECQRGDHRGVIRQTSGNPSGFLALALKPDLPQKPATPFGAVMVLSFTATTLGYGGAAWYVAHAIVTRGL
jgi:hypothetical protein